VTLQDDTLSLVCRDSYGQFVRLLALPFAGIERVTLRTLPSEAKMRAAIGNSIGVGMGIGVAGSIVTAIMLRSAPYGPGPSVAIKVIVFVATVSAVVGFIVNMLVSMSAARRDLVELLLWTSPVRHVAVGVGSTQVDSALAALRWAGLAIETTARESAEAMEPVQHLADCEQGTGKWRMRECLACHERYQEGAAACPNCGVPASVSRPGTH